MEFAEARDQYVELVQSVQALVPGDWDELNLTAWDCELGSGAGAQVTTVSTGPAVQADALDRLEDAVKAIGAERQLEFSIETVKANGIAVRRLRYPAEGVASDGMYLDVGFGTQASSILGASACGTGNSTDLNRQ